MRKFARGPVRAYECQAITIRVDLACWTRSRRTSNPVTNKKGIRMSDFKDSANEKIDQAADAAKKVTDKVVDKTKDAAHDVGKKMEEGGKRLKDA